MRSIVAVLRHSRANAPEEGPPDVATLYMGQEPISIIEGHYYQTLKRV